MRAILLLTVGAVVASACVMLPTTYACDATSACPSGLSCCADQFCRADCGADSGVTGGGGAATGGGGGGGATMDAGCADFESKYLTALDAAKVCNPNSLIDQCRETRPNSIVCGCATFIAQGAGAQLDTLTADFLDAGCMPSVCPRCSIVDAGMCQASSTPDIGACIDL